MRSKSRIVAPGILAPGILVGCGLGFAALVCGLLAGAPAAAVDGEPAPQRRAQLVRLVRQDCGSCHGSRLTGGLGPALTPSALQAWTVAGLAATILHGRPGTPMPPWNSFMSQAEADWIARSLLAGFPKEAEASR